MSLTKGKAVTQQDSITHMPRFNEAIRIDIEIDSIYQKMLDQLPDDYKHREVLAHAIVGSGVENGTISYVYNALCGFTNDVDFKVEDVVICNEIDRRERYDANFEDEDGKLFVEPNNQTVEQADYKPNWRTRKIAIGKCKVVKINLYAKDKLTVEFEHYSYNGRDIETTTEKVNHKNCSHVPAPEPVVG